MTQTKKIILSTKLTHRKQLEKLVEKKHLQLARLSTRLEMLKMQIEIIKREYHIRIGKLILKDSQLDLEIIRLKNILNLVKMGTSYEEAVEKIDKQFEPEIENFQQQYEYLNQEEKVFSHLEDNSNQQKQEVKKLWKKILFAFHPDLVSDLNEKKKRESIMKKVNEAYTKNDLAALKEIEQQEFLDHPKQADLHKLEKLVVYLENKIVKVEEEYQLLRQSEWYGYRRKFEQAKKTGQDIFKDLEKKLLDDVVNKFSLVNNLKAQLNQAEYL